MGQTTTAVTVIVLACMVRQIDRWWYRFGVGRGSDPVGLARVMGHQRARANNVTPALLVVCHWVEMLAWCALLGVKGVVGCIALMLVAAVKFRHLQEVTHFAVHGVLARSRRWGDLLAEVFFQAPLLMSSVEQRRRVHVREHHPNATVRPTDPNLKLLADAGIHIGSDPRRAWLGIVFPLTPRGMAASVRDIAANATIYRLAFPIGLAVTCFMLASWPGLVFGFAAPRLITYPLLSWMSLLVEHRWLDPVVRGGRPEEAESGRCYRLYPYQPLSLLIARATWLPYGDAFHYAHSVHQAVRWNYLPLVDRMLTGQVAEPRAVFLGRDSVLGMLYRKAAYGATQ